MEKAAAEPTAPLKQAVLVEGPKWGDAEFYGQWLLEAAKAQQLLTQAKRDDPAFCQAIKILEMVQALDYGIMATVFLSQFSQLPHEQFYTFVLDVSADELTDLSLMAEMEFFTLTQDRYQMVVPRDLNVERVKQAHLALAETVADEEDWIHPERLLVAMPQDRAKRLQQQLREMDEDQRLAERNSLLHRSLLHRSN